MSPCLVDMWTRTTHLAAARVRALAGHTHINGAMKAAPRRDTVQVAAGKAPAAITTTGNVAAARVAKVAAARVAKVAASTIATLRVTKVATRLTHLMQARVTKTAARTASKAAIKTVIPPWKSW